MTITTKPRVLVIGAGVAGSSFGATVDTNQFDVTIAEKAEFPRVKICGGCIGPPGLRCLAKLGVEQLVRDQSSQTRRWIGYADGQTLRIDVPGGVAVCRSVLDPLLLDAAIANQCQVKMSTPVRLLDNGSSDKKLSGVESGGAARVLLNDREMSFDLVVAASGLSGLNLTTYLPWRAEPHGPLGIGFHLRGEIEPEAIHMILGDAGYVGLVQLPGNRIDVAAAITPTAGVHPMQTVENMIGVAKFDIDCSTDDRIGDVMTTPPLRRQRSAAKGRLIAIGDAHRYVEPFTGEGMTWAMQTAIAAAELLNNHGPAAMADRYPHVAGNIASRHRRRCERLTSAIRYRAVRRIAGWGLANFPSLAAPIVRHLASD